jgi:hypothetical protein
MYLDHGKLLKYLKNNKILMSSLKLNDSNNNWINKFRYLQYLKFKFKDMKNNLRIYEFDFV